MGITFFDPSHVLQSIFEQISGTLDFFAPNFSLNEIVQRNSDFNPFKFLILNFLGSRSFRSQNFFCSQMLSRLTFIGTKTILNLKIFLTKDFKWISWIILLWVQREQKEHFYLELFSLTCKILCQNVSISIKLYHVVSHWIFITLYHNVSHCIMLYHIIYHCIILYHIVSPTI